MATKSGGSTGGSTNSTASTRGSSGSGGGSGSGSSGSTVTAAAAAAPSAAAAAATSASQDLSRALEFLDTVKTRTTPAIFADFLGIIRQFKRGGLSGDQVQAQVSLLLRDYPDLVGGFALFLPSPPASSSASASASTPHAEPHDAHDAHDASSSRARKHPHPSSRSSRSVRSQASTVRAAAASNILGRMSQQPPHSDQQQQQQAASGTGNGGIPHASQHQQQRAASNMAAGAANNHDGNVIADFSRAVGFVNAVKAAYADQPAVYNDFLVILRGYHKELRPVREVLDAMKQLFADKPELISGFVEFIPRSAREELEREQREQQEQQQSDTMRRADSNATLDGTGLFEPHGPSAGKGKQRATGGQGDSGPSSSSSSSWWPSFAAKKTDAPAAIGERQPLLGPSTPAASARTEAAQRDVEAQPLTTAGPPPSRAWPRALIPVGILAWVVLLAILFVVVEREHLPEWIAPSEPTAAAIA
ncbi:hypothetical protein BC831DRAFT_449817 [Entophlyctis helioformis]|nr:hypothetical protein BC831DRAFT_449817 [Entophlyctis helioformis]